MWLCTGPKRGNVRKLLLHGIVCLHLCRTTVDEKLNASGEARVVGGQHLRRGSLLRAKRIPFLAAVGD
jgi:hypothetical protein